MSSGLACSCGRMPRLQHGSDACDVQRGCDQATVHCPMPLSSHSASNQSALPCKLTWTWSQAGPFQLILQDVLCSLQGSTHHPSSTCTHTDTYVVYIYIYIYIHIHAQQAMHCMGQFAGMGGCLSESHGFVARESREDWFQVAFRGLPQVSLENTTWSDFL